MIAAAGLVHSKGVGFSFQLSRYSSMWRRSAALLGMAHGKHVYVEKPCGHNAYEGELLVAAAKKYPRQILQMGIQRRSFPTLIEAVQQVREGLIGKAYYAKAWYNNNRKSIGIGKKTPVPAGLDFNLWQTLAVA